VASGGADFGIAWLPKVLASREQGAKLINVLKNGPTLGIGHMTWMLNEINALIWPSPQGVGMMESRAFEQTVRIAHQYQTIKNRPDAGTYRTDLAQQALADLTAQGLDVRGLGFQKRAVQVTRGGE
jgi:NitT/TauT family transport system substrate-binding protein